MAKPKKDKAARPDKYAERLVLNTSFEEAIQLLADHANQTVYDSLNELRIQEPPQGE